jgi:hypothetical protein
MYNGARLHQAGALIGQKCVRDIAPADTLAQVKTINEVDRAAADEGAVEKPVELDEKQIVGLDLV